MANAVAIAIVSVVCIALFIASFIYWWYIHPKEFTFKKHWSHLFICVYSMTFSFLCMFAVPVDVYNITSQYQSDDEFNLEDFEDNASSLKTLYYTMFITLLFNSFVLLPFAFFYDGESKTAACEGLNAAGIMSSVLVIAVVTEYFLLPVADSAMTSYLSFGFGIHVLSLFTQNMALLAMLAWGSYVAFGLANLPLNLIFNTLGDVTGQVYGLTLRT